MQVHIYKLNNRSDLIVMLLTMVDSHLNIYIYLFFLHDVNKLLSITNRVKYYNLKTVSQNRLTFISITQIRLNRNLLRVCARQTHFVGQKKIFLITRENFRENVLVTNK